MRSAGVAACWTIGGTMDTSNERIGVLMEAIAIRAFTAVLDLDASEFLT